MSAKQKRKPTGRPKGAKNRDYSAVVAEIPAACPYCGGHNLQPVGDRVQRIEYAGRTIAGDAYQRKEVRRCKCGDCERFCMKHSYFGVENTAASVKTRSAGDDS